MIGKYDAIAKAVKGSAFVDPVEENLLKPSKNIWKYDPPKIPPKYPPKYLPNTLKNIIQIPENVNVRKSR